jgi:hypothetical protein
MARMSPETYKPLLQFRFKVQFSLLEDIGFYGKSISLPTAENNPITIDYGNTYFKVKGKTRWNDITLSCNAFEGKTQEQLWIWVDTYHQKVDQGKDTFPAEYKKDLYIRLLSPNDEKIVASWQLIGAFISNINYGQVDWSAEEIIQPEISIAFDYALFLSDYLTPAPPATQ